MFRFESIYLDNANVSGRIIDIFRPDQISASTAVFFIHGGGWRAGSRTIYHPIMSLLCSKGIFCASADYRLDVNVLEQLGDLREAYSFFSTELLKDNISKIMVFGSSAGGHLALLLALARPGACGEKVLSNACHGNQPIAVTTVSAPVNFVPWPEMFPPIAEDMRRAAGVAYEADPSLYLRLSPICHIGIDSCPVLLLHAENEHMFPLSQSIDFQKKMKLFNCHCELKIYPDAEHGFFYNVTRKCQRDAFLDMELFLQRLMAF